MREFTANFEKAAEFCGWSEDRKALGLPLYLKVVWFNSIYSDQMTYLEMPDGLEKQPLSESTSWGLRQNLIQRKQSEKEPLSDYTQDIRRLCMRLHLPREEWVYYIIQGLKPSIRFHVVLQKPDSFDNKL